MQEQLLIFNFKKPEKEDGWNIKTFLHEFQSKDGLGVYFIEY